MTLGDLAAVECRVAQLAGEGDAGSAPASPRSVAAFAALLGSLPAAPAAAEAFAPASGVGLERDARLKRDAGFERLIAGACAANGADPALVKAIVANESGFDPVATSPAGARGLMQLMPGTAAGLGVRDAYDPAQNIAGGTRYLTGLLRRFNGDVPMAVAAYNAGPEAIARGEMPAETQRYVRAVLDSYGRYSAEKSSH